MFTIMVTMVTTYSNDLVELNFLSQVMNRGPQPRPGLIKRTNKVCCKVFNSELNSEPTLPNQYVSSDGTERR